jgi:AcrR family transcriptional regulator
MQAIPRRERTRPTITEQARRAQIVAAAIETIAEAGYPRASFARIARRAGLSSTGLISDHFKTKKDLDQAVVADIFERLSRHMHEVMADVSGPQAALAAYIEGLTRFMKTDPPALQAMMGIVLGGGFAWDAEAEREATSPLTDILQRGQAEGVFRAFDLTVMATTIQRALDGIPLLQAADPNLDLDAYARELVEIFTLATQAHA